MSDIFVFVVVILWLVALTAMSIIMFILINNQSDLLYILRDDINILKFGDKDD